MIYSVFQDYQYAFIGYIAVAVILTVALLCMAVPPIWKAVRKRVKPALPEVIIRAVGVIVILCILCLRTVPDIAHNAAAQRAYQNGTCNSLTGTIHDIRIVYEGGRSESYSVSFLVDEVAFSDAILTDRAQAEAIGRHEGETVRVQYGDMSEALYLYVIERVESQ